MTNSPVQIFEVACDTYTHTHLPRHSHAHTVHAIAHTLFCRLNIMRLGKRFKLIDLDAAANFSEHEPDFAGSKSSSAYCAPEMVYQSSNGWRVKTYPVEQSQEQKSLYQPQRAAPQLDMWSFGAVLYLMVRTHVGSAA
jgi:serine/threonine protein kinase